MTYPEQLWQAKEPFAWLRARGLSDETIWEADLGYVGEPESEDHERFLGAISIPYHDSQERARPMRFRQLRPDARSKYDAEKGGGRHLYGVEFTQAPTVYLTEGEFDALILRQMGYQAVGIPGAKAWRREWRWLFRDSDLVVVVMDFDTNEEEAGQKAARRISGQVSQVTEVRTVDLPPGMDVTDLYVKDEDLLRRFL